MKIHAAELVCSLGRDINTACAAARAGLTRLDGLACRIRGDYLDDETAVGHTSSELTSGFEGDSRLIRLLSQVVDNISRQTTATTAVRGRIGWFVSLPSAARIQSGLDALEGTARSNYEEALPELVASADSVRGKEIVLASLAAIGRKELMGQVQVCTNGQVGFAELVMAAEAELDASTIDTAIVAGVDALVAEPEVRWLQVTGRLKTDEHAAGLSPGEAAAAIIVTKTGSVAGQGIPAIAEIRGVQIAQATRSFSSGTAADGSGLVEVLHPFARAQCEDGQIPWLVTDQNGEYFRAADWGHAFAMLFARAPGYENATVWQPASSFGDTGSASGAVGICMVLRAYARKYAPSSLAVVVLSNDGPERAALLIQDE